MYHFLHRFHNYFLIALGSYNIDLHLELLIEFHNTHERNTYLQRMRLSTTKINDRGENGLWGNILYLKWLAYWINIPICIWSLTCKIMYLHFNKDACNPIISILIHNTISIVGHYEPIFSWINAYNCIQNIQSHF